MPSNGRPYVQGTDRGGHFHHIPELLERDKAKIMAAQTEGTYKARRLVYVAKDDFGPRPAQGAMLTLDGKAYKVKSCTEEAGVLAIELEAVRS